MVYRKVQSFKYLIVLLQVLRKRTSYDPAFMFYHNPSLGIEELLQTTSWLKPIETVTSPNGEEFPFGKVADIFAAAIVRMNGTKNTVLLATVILE